MTKAGKLVADPPISPHHDVDMPVLAFAGSLYTGQDPPAQPQTPCLSRRGRRRPACLGRRGGRVYRVTSLKDSGPGSLRDAVSAPHRTIVFAVSGVIRLDSALIIRADSLTIAGQTAPGDGICLTGYGLAVEGSHLIIRYLRCRLGDTRHQEDDAMHCTSTRYPSPYHDIIIDHCSLSWSVDETGSFYGVRDFTLQWCILSESLYHSIHSKGNHGYGGIWGGNRASFHHNLLASHSSRTPRFCGSRYTGHPEAEVADFRNNVIYNWGRINSAYGGEGGHYNMINNYYKPGPATPGDLHRAGPANKRHRILQYTSYYYAPDAAVYPDTLYGGSFFIRGNVVEGYPTVSADNWTLGVQPDLYPEAAALLRRARRDRPFPCPPVRTQTAREAFISVLDSAGALLPRRDTVDRRLIREARSGSATYEGQAYRSVHSQGISHPSGIIDSPRDVGGLPRYRSAPAAPDRDLDGMTDRWETSHGLDPASPGDANDYTLSTQYTNLEVYLNSLTGMVNVQP